MGVLQTVRVFVWVISIPHLPPLSLNMSNLIYHRDTRTRPRKKRTIYYVDVSLFLLHRFQSPSAIMIIKAL